nr:MAG TPA: Protein of unknown function (DUF3659) [Crassvirales sp.]
MAVDNIDFEGVEEKTAQSASTEQPANAANNGEDTTSLSGDQTDDITGKSEVEKETKTEGGESTDDNSSTGELAEGDKLEVDGKTYTVDANGNIVDEQGSIFKEAKEVADWMKSLEVEEETEDKGLNIASIQKALGVTVTDEKGKEVEFTDDAEGVKSYVDSVIALKSNELQQAAINRLYADNPLLKQFQDYVSLTGTPRGFGDIPDRSGIELDKDNEAQQIAVIKMAAAEFGNKSLNDNYIQYLKNSGSLYDEAKMQLKSLVEKDKAVQKDIETRAAEQRAEEERAVAEYWNNVNNIINGRMIAGYKIPESFTKEVDGKKMTYTPNDFFGYVSSPTVQLQDGRQVTQYQYDLSQLSDEDYLNREMLDAWLMFTGGTYKDLMGMAAKEDKVRTLKLKAKEQRTSSAVKVIRNSSKKANLDDIIL